MFSGHHPYHDITNDYQAIFTIQRGKRPSRPSHDMCRTRGLNDEMWDLIEICWTTDPSDRPSASEIIEQLCALPNRPTDQRSKDNYSLPFQVLDTPATQLPAPSRGKGMPLPSFGSHHLVTKSTSRTSMEELCAVPNQPTNPGGRSGSPAGFTAASLPHTVAEITTDIFSLVRVTVQVL